MRNERNKSRPLDNILEFNQLMSFNSLEENAEIILETIVKFESLPITGWHDGNEALDSKCKQSCVKDCSCVSHCGWIVY